MVNVPSVPGFSQKRLTGCSVVRDGMTRVVSGAAVFAALEALRHPRALRGVRGGNALSGRRWCTGVGILRLRMTSTSWTLCFAQDDREGAKARERSVRPTRAR
jgi:hypothetical protein